MITIIIIIISAGLLFDAGTDVPLMCFCCYLIWSGDLTVGRLLILFAIVAIIYTILYYTILYHTIHSIFDTLYSMICTTTDTPYYTILYYIIIIIITIIICIINYPQVGQFYTYRSVLFSYRRSDNDTCVYIHIYTYIHICMCIYVCK